MKNCQTIADALEEFVLRRCSAQEVEEIKDHLLLCADCRSLLLEIEGFVRDLQIALSLIQAPDPPSLSNAAASRPEQERRAYRRRACNTLVSVATTLRPGVLGLIHGRVVDTSYEGACLILPQALPVSASTLIHLPKTRLRAAVRHCGKTAQGYQIGVKLAAGFIWAE